MNDKESLVEEIEKLKEQIEELEANENADEYEEELNELYGDVKVCGYFMQSGRVLREMDEIAFNEALTNYNDEKITELKEELEEKEEELKALESEGGINGN